MSDSGAVPPGKKAVHVKWAGKTIALGTFASAEADEKCARAKALTRAWRSTMRPKPTREWVMAELERLGVRVVSGRLGRKAGEEDEPEEKKSSVSPPTTSIPAASSAVPAWSSSVSELDNIIQQQQRRNSSLGLSMMSDRDFNRRGSLGSLGPLLVGFDGVDPTMPPHRPFVGGGSAAAYEAARADHYAQKREDQVQRASLSLAMGSNMAGLSVNPNQHYEMLKLHHMNLLNEIQETTLMMNLYQQQQLQQQQQQLQQRKASAESVLPDMTIPKGISSSLVSVEGDSPQESAPSKKDKTRSTATGSTTKKARKTKDKEKDKDKEKVKEKEKEKGKEKVKEKEKEKVKEKEKEKEKEETTSSPPDAGIDAAPKKSDLKEELLKSQKEREALEAELKKIKEDYARKEKEAEGRLLI